LEIIRQTVLSRGQDTADGEILHTHIWQIPLDVLSIYMYTYIHAHIHTHIQIHHHTYMHTCKHTFNKYENTRTYMNTYIRTVLIRISFCFNLEQLSKTKLRVWPWETTYFTRDLVKRLQNEKTFFTLMAAILRPVLYCGRSQVFYAYLCLVYECS